MLPLVNPVGQFAVHVMVPVQLPVMLGTSSPINVPVSAIPRQLPFAPGVSVYVPLVCVPASFSVEEKWIAPKFPLMSPENWLTFCTRPFAMETHVALRTEMELAELRRGHCLLR